jgi:carbamoyltransferase
MRILGSKFWGEDSSICILDFDKKEIFCINTDRVSRIKKDNYDVSQILNKFTNLIDKPNIIASSFNTFDGHDTCLENKGTSYYWLGFQKIIRNIIKPKYYADLEKKNSIFKKIYIFFRLLFFPSFFFYFFRWKYLMNKYLNKKINDKNFHFKYCVMHIKKIFKEINIKVKDEELFFYDHHTCHAASAYYLSDFYKKNQEAFVFTLDQQGDHTFSSLFKFTDLKREEISRSLTQRAIVDKKVYIISIATIYSLFTKTLGFRENCDEGKVEALAAYGEPDNRTLKDLNEIIYLSSVNQKIKFETNRLKFINFFKENNLHLLLKKLGRENFSSTIQNWLENIVISFLNKALPKDKKVNLCLAGGVIANVILNYKIFQNCRINNIYVCPPMGDEGSALGAAFLAAINKNLDIKWLSKDVMPYWGPSYNKDETLAILKKNNHKIIFEDLKTNWTKKAADKIYENKVIAIFQGRMEFGPRALGNRSILANVTDPNMKTKINISIKKRPEFQPFCPAVLEEDREDLFLNSFKHKYMATAFLMKENFRKRYPSAVHVDGTARPQFVEKEDNENLYKILQELKKKINHGIVINTSFNLHGRSMVMKPQDAIDDFLACDLDYLYLNEYEVKKI